MSVARVISQSRTALSRGFTTRRAAGSLLHFVSTAAPQLQFSSSARIQEEVVQAPATGREAPLTAICNATPGNNAHSIAVTKMAWNTVPADVEQLLRNAGCPIKKLQMRIERFTFQSDTSAFIELGSKEQVDKAVKALNNQKVNGRTLKVTPMSDTFYWDSGFKKHQRFFYYDATTPSQAIQGVLDGRRYRLYVENPGWVPEVDEAMSVNAKRREVINKAFEPFNVEAIGAVHPVWKKDGRGHKTFVTHIEFSTKEDAQRAVDALNDTVVEGKLVELKPFTVIGKRAEHIGRVDKGVLAQLQEAGLLTSEGDPDAM
ncbi:uncharacterized protein M421DRAFT_423136 [Didymella exigua CBS 183.55]|uniref:RRM domain-containing protein n=1 Tax=Didymella exigua CBS 183.55 TaxID=1150837 RepID=A0A6A5RI80_9PLEO|nr:uncharacterized protein M421DRAFT_423136 [Didymella exigua CBS 183.55]KAF1926146.1 hypothetical protein M421DRAFT_423136 [Didymella exigua CBS 183.55]